MIRYAFRERLTEVPIVWGIVTALGYTFIGQRPEKGVIPLAIALTFLCAAIAHISKERRRVQAVAFGLALVFATATGWLAFRYPLPFS